MRAIHSHIDHASPPSDAAFFICGRACLRAKTATGLTLISISGDIDASNVEGVSRRASEVSSDCDALIVDLAAATSTPQTAFMHCSRSICTVPLRAGRGR